MLSSEREAFTQHAALLCSGFNVPATQDRLDAYWLGLQRMQLPAFVRVVEHALGERGPERIPTAPQCWGLLKQLRSTRPVAPTVTQAEAYDHFHGFGQRCLLTWLRENGPVEPDVLARLVAGKNRLVGQFREIATEDEVTALEVRPAMFREFRRLTA